MDDLTITEERDQYGRPQYRIDPFGPDPEGRQGVILVGGYKSAAGLRVATITVKETIFFNTTDARQYAAAILRACDLADQVRRGSLGGSLKPSPTNPTTDQGEKEA